jgi:hypothetical protein
MAGRSGIGAGLGALIAILGVLCLTFFVTTIIFWSNASKTKRELDAANADNAAFIAPGERSSDEYQRIKDVASKAEGRPSVTKYLNNSLRESMQRVTGVRADGLEQLVEKLGSVPGADATPLLTLHRGLENKTREMEAAVQSAEAARRAAESNLTLEIERVKQIEAGHAKTIAALNDNLNQYKADLEKNQSEIGDTKNLMDQRVTRIQDEFAAKEKELRERNSALSRDNLRLNEEISTLRGVAKDSLVKPADEATLVDGTIIGVNQSEGEVFMSLGRRDKVVLGMTFSVYNSASSLRPDPATGQLPEPKALIEITNVAADSSTARIKPGSERRGNPVVRGDVIVNAIYDPKKVYKFVVFGNFDPKGTGIATESAASEIEATIAGWGGKIEPELSGDIDFLVLGQRPVLPSQPRAGAPSAVVQEYSRQFTKAKRYDDLLKQAQATSLPVLSENRLFTLIGR